MKIKLFENKYGTEIEFVPETPEETATLLRVTNSTKSQKPEIVFRFNPDQNPNMKIWMPKIKEAAQKNWITNDSRGK